MIMEVSSNLTLADLKTRNQWVCADLNKAPINAKTGGKAMPNNSSTWSTADTARKYWLNHPENISGVGYVLSKNDGIVCVDLDKCIDADGKISDFAQDIVNQLNSYTEYSPSKTGLHIWIQGAIPKNLPQHKNDTGKIEMYGQEHYLTVTNNHYEGTPATIENRADIVLNLYNDVTQKRQSLQRDDRTSKNRNVNQQSLAELDTPYGLAALKRECRELAEMTEGGRNHRLNTAAFTIGQLVAGGALTQATAENELTEAARTCGLGEAEISATMRSGFKSGLQDPREVPDNRQTATPSSSFGVYASTPKPAYERVSIDFVKRCYHEQESGDALLFAELFRGKVIFDHTTQTWHIWRGHYWEEDLTGSVKYLVSGKLASAYLRATAGINDEAVVTASKITGNTADDKKERETIMEEADALVKGFQQRAASLRNASRCKNVLFFVTAVDGMKTEKRFWDRNPWLMAVKNGVVDLRTGELRAGEPADMIRTASPTTWQGLMHPAPRWERFLEEIFADRSPKERTEIIAFLQRVLGYGTTGIVSEHLFLVLWGADGRNGKDTIAQAIHHALGEVSNTMHKDVLLASDKGHNAGAASPHLSDLQGRRMAWASEPEKGARFNIGQIKELSGGNFIATRAPYERGITKIDPTHLLILLTNHKPHADADDAAFWDRLRMVEFNMRFVDNPTADNERKKDAKLWSALKEEAAGILAWLVRGCLLWQQEGKVTTPDCVFEAVQKYQDEEDTMGNCLKEISVLHEKAQAQAGEIYDAYKVWAVAGSMKPMSSTAFFTQFSKRLKRMNVTKGRNASGYVYKGIGLSAYRPGQTSVPEAQEYDQEVYGTIHKNVGFEGNHTHPTEGASEASLQPLILPWNVGCVELDHKLAVQQPHEDTELHVTGSTLHTMHSTTLEGGMRQPDRPVQEGVYSSQKPYTKPYTTLHNPTPSNQHDESEDNGKEVYTL